MAGFAFLGSLLGKMGAAKGAATGASAGASGSGSIVSMLSSMLGKGGRNQPQKKEVKTPIIELVAKSAKQKAGVVDYDTSAPVDVYGGTPSTPRVSEILNSVQRMKSGKEKNDVSDLYDDKDQQPKKESKIISFLSNMLSGNNKKGTESVTGTQGQKIRVRDANGKEYLLPAYQLQDAIKQGYVLAQ